MVRTVAVPRLLLMELSTVASPVLWVGFIGFVLAMLALDLGVFHKKAHAVSFKEAAAWSAVWIALSLAFSGFVWTHFGPTAGIEFLTGYFIEKSLSIDNIFVFVVIFGALGIPNALQHRVLFWGILSALVLRAAMIFGGVALLERFHWLTYVFGAFLVITAVKLFAHRDESVVHPETSIVMRAAKRVIPSTSTLDGSKFFTKVDGRWLATPLLLTLILVEASDVIFAVDSIPAIFAVTRDPFIVFTSNIFAILGLRSLFFMLANIIEKFAYLKIGLAFVLAFVGTKMLLASFIKIPPLVSLAVVLGTIGMSLIASLLRDRAARASIPR